MSCDKCGAVEGVETFTISNNRGTVVVDLCPRHSKPLVDAYRYGSMKPRGRRPREQAPTHAVEPFEFKPKD